MKKQTNKKAKPVKAWALVSRVGAISVCGSAGELAIFRQKYSAQCAVEEFERVARVLIKELP